MKAKYLKIGGEKVDAGQSYWEVLGIHPFNISHNIEKGQNNTINTCYFYTEGEAQTYKEMVEASRKLNAAIKRIENKHAYKPDHIIYE